MNAPVSGQRPLFPLIRHLSARLTPIFLQTPVSANQITTASLGLGLAAAGLLTTPDPATDLAAAGLLLGAYVLDNCDGEVARARGRASSFGRHYDTFVDWVVHTAFFVGLGVGVEARLGDDLWFWMGIIAAAGGTLNYALGRLFEYLDGKAAAGSRDEVREGDSSAQRPTTTGQWLVFAFRELARADFCFLVVALALPGWLWVLLPAGMVGAQAYWMTVCIKSARRNRA